MRLSNGEKLILAMLAGIYKKLEINDDIDPDIVLAGVRGDSHWILEREYGNIVGSSDPPPEVTETYNILDMYRSIESSFQNFSDAEKERVKIESHPSQEYVRFQGFDANNDPQYGILHDLVNVLGTYDERKGGIINSHSSVSLLKYRRMLGVFHGMSDLHRDRGLTANGLIQILKA
jgi:uncharacterized protein